MRTKNGRSVKCESCGIEFYVTPGRLTKNKHHTCSKQCIGILSSKLHSKKVEVPCVICGTSIFYKKSHIRQIKYPTCSMACAGKSKSLHNRGHDNPKSLNLNEGDRWFWEKAKDLQRRSSIIGIPSDLDYLFLKELFLKQNGKCHYTGMEMIKKTKNDENKKWIAAGFNVASVDRVDSSRGYTRDNVVFCINSINMLKGNHSIEDFKSVFRAIMFREDSDLKMKVKKLTASSLGLYKADPFASGYDVFADRIEDHGHFIKVFTGIAVEPPKGYWFLLTARSSIFKKGLTLYNNLGIIDQNYTGEIICVFLKTEMYKKIEIGERIAQLVPQNFIKFEPIFVDELSETERGAGGFGSSGS